MPEPYYTDEQVTLFLGDCLDVMATLDAASVDAVITDPPYELAFMGRAWDASGVAFQPETWRHCLRILKPGGHLLAFGGSRTWHRLAAAIEDAGFEIRDSLAWIYGSGFPKSLDVSKAIDKAAGAERERYDRPAFGGSFCDDGGTTYGTALTETPITGAAKQWQGWGTALKPAFEPIVVARKPLCGTVAANVLAHRTGALNIDGCRVEAHDSQLAEKYASVQTAGARANSVYGTDARDRAGSAPHTAGRWPANVVLDDAAAAELDRQSGHLPGGVTVRRNLRGREQNAHGIYGSRKRDASEDFTYGDSGGASRFFPTFRYTAKAATAERPTADGVAHPTVKPLDLMRWLVRLVTPPGGTVLEPFAGSGTTVEACIHEHKRCIAIEREPSYLPLIRARLSKPMQVGFDFEAGA